MLQRYITHLCPGLLSSLAVLLILWLTLLPDPLAGADPGMFDFPHADKVLHALMFGGLVFALLLDRELFSQRRYEQTGRFVAEGLSGRLILTILAISFGGLIELLQGVMDMGRGAEWADFLADSLGAIISMVVSPRIIALLMERR